MFELLKIVGVSAVLSAGLVTASEVQPQAGSDPASGKIYTDRVPQEDAAPARVLRVTYASTGLSEGEGTQTSKEAKGDLRKAPERACATQAWPHIAPECLRAADGASHRGSVRMITVEQREGVNTSVLVRVPAPPPRSPSAEGARRQNAPAKPAAST